MPFRRVSALLLVPLLAVGAALLTAAPALAHTTLETSTPAEGASLPDAPTTVVLTFGEPVTLPPDPIRVTGPDGVAWTIGAATVTDATVTAPVTASGPAGAYTLSWQVVSDDGDTIKGTVRFTLASAATPTTTPAAGPTAAPASTAPAAGTRKWSGGMPGWLWALIGAVVVAAAAGVVVTRRRARQP